MSDYVVSARKYRPDTFESLIGQDTIARTLKNSIKRGQLAHAYLFCGPRGVGKTSAARIFAKTINCANPGPDLEPCGECDSCRSFREGRSYCIHELDAASNNGVDDIKALLDQVQIPPQSGRYSVYIIDEVHMLSQSAFNAFLKTLEEPPAHAIFILATTEKHKILPTILSRCQTYDFNRISVPDIVRNLRDIAGKENIHVDDESLHIIAHKADGAMRDALTIFDQTVAFCGTDIKCEDVMRNLNVLDYEYSFRLVDSFLNGDYATALLIFDEVLNKGFNALHFVSALSSHLRDLLVSRTAGLGSLLDLPDSLKTRYEEQAKRCPVKFLYDALGITTQCEAGYRMSANQRLFIEFALMKLAFLVKAPALAPALAPVPVPVPAPAPVAPATPAASVAHAAPAADAKAPCRRTVKNGSPLSMAAILNEDGNKTIHVEESIAAQSDVEITEELIIQKWKELADLHAAQPRLANVIKLAKLTVTDDTDGKKLVEFQVTNEAQKNWIAEKVLRDLENEFCSLLGSGVVRLAPMVEAENDKPAKIYMPSEQAEDLIKKNDEVRDLVVDLGLDIR